MLDISELKKDHRTNYLAEMLEKILREEAEVREMLSGDDSLHEMAAKELKFIQEERERIEKQVQEILDKEKIEEEITNEIVLLKSDIKISRKTEESTGLRGLFLE